MAGKKWYYPSLFDRARQLHLPNLLAIETSGEVCSVAICSGKAVWAGQETGTNKHAEKLLSLISDGLKCIEMNLHQLDAVVVSDGPGSYTGLRIGMATAKGLCWGLGIPLIAVRTLDALAAHAHSLEGAVLYAPMIDARRMEVFMGLYDAEDKLIEAPFAHVFDAEFWQPYLSRGKIAFCGSGAEKITAALNHPNAKLLNFSASAEWLLPLARQKFAAGEFADLSTHTPYYLKPVAIGPAKQG